MLQRNPEAQQVLEVSMRTTFPNFSCEYKETSEGLLHEVAEFPMWLANGFPPWSSYRTLMSGRLIALDKNPGVRSIGIGES